MIFCVFLLDICKLLWLESDYIVTYALCAGESWGRGAVIADSLRDATSSLRGEVYFYLHNFELFFTH